MLAEVEKSKSKEGSPAEACHKAFVAVPPAEQEQCWKELLHATSSKGRVLLLTGSLWRMFSLAEKVELISTLAADIPDKGRLISRLRHGRA